MFHNFPKYFLFLVNSATPEGVISGIPTENVNTQTDVRSLDDNISLLEINQTHYRGTKRFLKMIGFIHLLKSRNSRRFLTRYLCRATVLQKTNKKPVGIIYIFCQWRGGHWSGLPIWRGPRVFRSHSKYITKSQRNELSLCVIFLDSGEVQTVKKKHHATWDAVAALGLTDAPCRRQARREL